MTAEKDPGDQPQPKPNGWTTGSDPVLRPLRVVATVVCLAVFVYLAVSVTLNDNANNVTAVLPTLGLALGAALMLLGYTDIILPGIGRRRKDD